MPEIDNEYERVWKIYCELGQIERHFNNAQSTYRALTSSWLLAAFGAIGFVLSRELALRIPGELVIASIGMAAAVGVYLLWVLDLLVTQRLLDAAYIEARNLENSHAWLPQVRNNMRILLGGKGLSLVVWFYVAGTAVVMCVGGLGLIVWLWTIHQTCFLLGAEIFICLGFVILVAIHMRRRTTITPNLEDKIASTRIARHRQ